MKLTVKQLEVAFSNGSKAVEGSCFELRESEVLAIVGESGSGKSVSCMALTGLLDKRTATISGEATLEIGEQKWNLLDLSPTQWGNIRGRHIGFVFQEPMSSLNPLQKCGKQVYEILHCHFNTSVSDAKQEVLRLFEKVRLPEPERIWNSYPHQLSGGQKQRVMIAMAVACKPSIIIADEPTTALDVSVQAQVLELFKELKADLGVSIIFISHDLGLVKNFADNILVMYKGKIVEKGNAQQVLHQPNHPYTKALLDCRPSLHQKLHRLPTLEPLAKHLVPETKIPKNIDAPLLLQVEQLCVSFPKSKNWLGQTTSKTKALDNLTITLREGESLGIIGESGSGKSTFAKVILGLEKAEGGKILFNEVNLANSSDKSWQMVFQDPFASLNPRMRIGEAIMEPMLVHGLALNRKDAKEQAISLLQKTGLPEAFWERFPSELSGGQRQRVGIARALSTRPKVLICDESVSALDVSVQAQVLNLLADLRDEMNLSLIFITHNFAVVRFLSDTIAVLKNGQLVEYGDTESILSHPKHAYTKLLMDAARN